MRTQWIVNCVVALLVLSWSGLAMAELYVVCNAETSLEAEEIFDVFLGGKQFSGGVKLVPVDNASAQELFLAKALRMDGVKYSTLWIKKSFRDGIRPPRVKAGDAETLQFVRQTPGGVGYVRIPSAGVKIIKKY